MDNLKITLEAARVNAGMTQAEVAKALCKNVSTIANWEKGKTKSIPVSDMVKLCCLYRIPQDNIFLPNA